MPILFIDCADRITVGDVINEFWNETGLSLQILNGQEPVSYETTIKHLQRLHLANVPDTFSLKEYRGACIIDIAKSVREIEGLLFERYLLSVRVLCNDGNQPEPNKALKFYIDKRHPSKYHTEADRISLQQRFFRIYSEAWEQIARAESCLEAMKTLRKESDTLSINVKVVYWLSDMYDDPVPEDIYTQFFLVYLDGQSFSSTYQELPDPPAYYLDGLFALGLTTYDILRLNYRIILSIDWGSCRKSQQDGVGLRY